MKKIIIIALFFISIVSFNLIAQVSINLEWSQQEVSNFTTGGNDKIPSILTDSEQNVFISSQGVIPGTSTSFLTFKYNEIGELQWRNTYNTSGSETIAGAFVDETGDIIIGGVSHPGGSGNAISSIIKYSAVGDTLWTFRYLTETTWANAFSTILKGEDGHIYASGISVEKIGEEEINYLVVVKISPEGEMVWENKYNEDITDSHGSRIARMIDNKIVVFGVTHSGLSGNQRIVLQISLDGETISTIEKPYTLDNFKHYKMDNKGNIYIGYRAHKYQVLKLNQEADTVFVYEKPVTASNPPNVAARLNSITTDEFNNAYAVGPHYGGEANSDILTTKLDSIGNVIWEKRYSHEDALYNYPVDIQIDNDYVYVVGSVFMDAANANYILVIYDRETGEEILSTTHDNKGWNDTAHSVLRDGDYLYVTGVSFHSGTADPEEIITLKYHLDISSGTLELVPVSPIQLFPNPAQDAICIAQNSTLLYQSYQLFDLRGRLIKEEKINTDKQYIDVAALPNGVYFISLYGEKGMHKQRFIKQ